MNTEFFLKSDLKELIDLAISLGASDTSIIKSSNIIIDTKLAELCKGDKNNGCSNYGRSLSCPPNVSGPSEFKLWQKHSNKTIIIRIDIPSSILLSKERLEVMKLLHEIVANIEIRAIKKGYHESISLAGGSCKEIFCFDYKECSALIKKENCRNLKYARPSMSGFGINVTELMKAAGWKNILTELKQKKNMWLAGIILIA